MKQAGMQAGASACANRMNGSCGCGFGAAAMRNVAVRFGALDDHSERVVDAALEWVGMSVLENDPLQMGFAMDSAADECVRLGGICQGQYAGQGGRQKTLAQLRELAKAHGAHVVVTWKWTRLSGEEDSPRLVLEVCRPGGVDTVMLPAAQLARGSAIGARELARHTVAPARLAQPVIVGNVFAKEH